VVFTADLRKGKKMGNFLKKTLVGASLASLALTSAGALVVATPAQASASLSFSPTTIAPGQTTAFTMANLDPAGCIASAFDGQTSTPSKVASDSTPSSLSYEDFVSSLPVDFSQSNTIVFQYWVGGPDPCDDYVGGTPDATASLTLQPLDPGISTSRTDVYEGEDFVFSSTLMTSNPTTVYGNPTTMAEFYGVLCAALFVDGEFGGSGPQSSTLNPFGWSVIGESGYDMSQDVDVEYRVYGFPDSSSNCDADDASPAYTDDYLSTNTVVFKKAGATRSGSESLANTGASPLVSVSLGLGAASVIVAGLSLMWAKRRRTRHS
jgi:hypothetical protein